VLFILRKVTRKKANVKWGKGWFDPVGMDIRIRARRTSLDIVDLNLLASGTGALVIRVTILVELEAAVAVVVGAEGIGLVDLGVVREFTVCLAVFGCQ